MDKQQGIAAIILILAWYFMQSSGATAVMAAYSTIERAKKCSDHMYETLHESFDNDEMLQPHLIALPIIEEV